MSGAFDSTDDRRWKNNSVLHTYRTLDEGEKADMAALKDAGADFLLRIDTVATRKGDSRELEVARQKVEEAVMWAVKHVTK